MTELDFDHHNFLIIIPWDMRNKHADWEKVETILINRADRESLRDVLVSI